jgi:AraC family transcriptional regulator of adaptative response/methylated-DNA-[protein]-cysteine methyltransferase
MTGDYQSNYQRIEQAIRYLDDHAREQPSLAGLAAHLGLSPHHCHRLFHRWAGITPKDFLQVATLEYAKRLLAASRPVLETALDSGLSGPSRLHDLFLGIDAMTPGEYRRGIEIRWGVHPTPVGDALFAATPRGICAIHFIQPGQESSSEAMLRRDWPNAALIADPDAVAAAAAEVAHRMTGAPAGSPLALVLRGTPFQIKVWQALLAIPAGTAETYAGVATAAGRPQAHRAAGSAIGANRIAYLIPCHRVLRSTGAVSGYRWGEVRKRALLALESTIAR